MPMRLATVESRLTKLTAALRCGALDDSERSAGHRDLASFLIDRDGSVARQFVGLYPTHVLEASVSELLAGKG